MVGRVCPRHGHRGRPLNSVVRHASNRNEETPVTSANGEQFPDPAFKPFSTRRIPPFPVAAENLVADRENELRNHIDVLGCQLFQARDDILSTLERLGANSAYRAQLGSLKAGEIEAFASLSPQD